jgi:hypothetical protein
LYVSPIIEHLADCSRVQGFEMRRAERIDLALDTSLSPVNHTNAEEGRLCHGRGKLAAEPWP